MTNGKDERARAVLVAVQLSDVDDTSFEADVAELGRLVDTLGLDVIGTVTQKRDALAPAAVLGEGKLKELAQFTGGDGIVPSGAKEVTNKAREKWKAERGDGDNQDDVDDSDEPDDDFDAGGSKRATHVSNRSDANKATVVIVDHEISPSQARNLERATGAEVLDRTGVIVEIFHRHARSREAKLQVEIARLNYVAPRMRETGGGGDRVRGGVGGKGAGESAVELDKRKIRDRIAELKIELAGVQKNDDQRRYARRDQLRVALVGYTNAGKSSLMRALTGSGVLVADRLFATLDTTVRALHPETKPRILVSDTVGFIKKLPHDLVASFRSTLDEALEASLLLYVADASDATYQEQLEVTQSVLGEIGAEKVHSLLLLNKADRLTDEQRTSIQRRHPGAHLLSAHDSTDVAALRQTIIDHFDGQMEEGELIVPYLRQALVSEIHEHARVVSETYDEVGTHLVVRALPAMMAQLRSRTGTPATTA